MAFQHGSKAVVTVNSVALTAYCDNVDIKISVDTADVSTFGNVWKANVVGQAGAQVTLAGDYDPTASTGPSAVLTGLIGSAAFPVIYGPGGSAVGQVKHTFNAFLTDYQESSAVNAAVKFSATLLLTGSDVISNY